MRRIDRMIQREFRREMNEYHGGLIAGVLILFALALALAGLPELGICIYVGVSIWVSIVFKRIARGVRGGKKGG